MKLINYREDIDKEIKKPGIIINYKNGIACTNGYLIGIYGDDYYYDKYYDINETIFNAECIGRYYKNEAIYLYEFKNDIILYLYFFRHDIHHSFKCSLNIGLYNKELIKFVVIKK